MTRTVTVPLREPATEMTREEILKQAAHLSGSLRNPRIAPDGTLLEFEVPEQEAARTRDVAEQLCGTIQKSLRRLERLELLEQFQRFILLRNPAHGLRPIFPDPKAPERCSSQVTPG